MKGARPLTKQECEKVLSCFTGLHAERNRLLFIMGVNTGFRISELLSITYGDVLDGNLHIKDSLRIMPSKMKGKKEGRSVDLSDKTKALLLDHFHANQYEFTVFSDKLFPITRYAAHKLLHKAFECAGLKGNVSTHSMRKTFAENIRAAAEKKGIDQLRACFQALGHKNINNTERYLSYLGSEVDELIEECGI